MAKTFRLDVVTPERLLLSEEVESLVAPSIEGMIGILAGHAPFLCVLKPGDVKIRSEGRDRFYVTSGGFMEVLPHRTNLLVEAAEDVEAIDLERARNARDRARERLASADRAVDKARARAALERAEARLRAVEKHRAP